MQDPLFPCPRMRTLTLGIAGNPQRNRTLGMALTTYVRTLFSEQLSERLSELVGRQNFSPNSRSFFFLKIEVIPARQTEGAGATTSLGVRPLNRIQP